MLLSAHTVDFNILPGYLHEILWITAMLGKDPNVLIHREFIFWNWHIFLSVNLNETIPTPLRNVGVNNSNFKAMALPFWCSR